MRPHEKALREYLEVHGCRRGVRMKIRRLLMALLAMIVLAPLSGCDAQDYFKRGSMKKQVVLDVVLYSYLDRPIFDIFLNGQLAGGAAAAYGGGGGIISGVVIPLGPQTLTWRDAGTGQTFVAKKPLIITADQIPANARYLGVHVYPDETAEFTFAQYMPAPSARGEEIYKEHHLYGR